jgi:predicted nucleic-acid-binding Zn-ribbon protein
MLSINELLPPTTPFVEVKKSRQYKQHTNSNANSVNTNSVTASNIDNILETEKQKNIKDTWNKLDKTLKIQKLNNFAIKYCQCSELYDHKVLIEFFKDALEHNKLQKKKDLNYDQNLHEIISIPSLSFRDNEFFINNVNRKRISTLKSLTPKRITNID